MKPSSPDITQLLVEASAGHGGALERLLPLLYEELRRLAAAYLRRRSGYQTLQPTALVHEAYLKLVDQRALTWQNRTHFFATAARAMRQVLINHAMAQRTAKRGGGEYVLSLEDAVGMTARPAVDLVALDEALQGLARLDPKKSRLVELRFFGGLTIEDAAAVLDVSPATLKREWASAKAWLHREMQRGSGGRA